MTDLPEERLDASTANTKVGVDYFSQLTIKIGKRHEKRWCCHFQMSNYESGAYKSCTQFGHR